MTTGLVLAQGILLSIAFIVLQAGTALGCSVPVFRYALERWTPSDYELIVFHRGTIEDQQRALIAGFTGTNAQGAVNITVRTVDLNSDPAVEDTALWARHKTLPLPAMVLRAPGRPGIQNEIWSGPLNELNARKVIDSPLRRKIVQLIRKGESAVWVLLESGDKAQDDQAMNRLKSRLEHLEKNLEIPKVTPADLASNESSPAEAELRVGFSLLRLARNEAQEDILIRMLLSTEDDLKDLKGPLAFPIFGRGRILYALSGEGINAEMIDEACSFLVGPCSCIVKDENPGFDLLVSAAWDSFVRITASPEQPSPELTGATSTSVASQAGATTTPATQASPAIVASIETRPATEGLVVRRVIFLPVVLGGLILLATAGLLLRGRKGRGNGR